MSSKAESDAGRMHSEKSQEVELYNVKNVYEQVVNDPSTVFSLKRFIQKSNPG